MNGNIFNVQRFCTSDGPGIRTTVFMKGCPLKCLWCHNPESQLKECEIMFYEDKCTHCGRCKSLDADFLCPNDAKKICGKAVTSDEVLLEVMKDRRFYENSGGGISLSGGEPLFQFEFASELLQKAKKKNLHTVVETCGFADKDEMTRIAQFTDLFLFDFKEGDPELHKAYTGVDNALIIDNLYLLNELKKDVILRCPMIPGYNDGRESLDRICELANALESIIGIEIEPYHAFGEGKYKALGRACPEILSPTEDQIEKIIDYISSRTDKPTKKA